LLKTTEVGGDQREPGPGAHDTRYGCRGGTAVAGSRGWQACNVIESQS
jgi:hypothetical protein